MSSKGFVVRLWPLAFAAPALGYSLTGCGNGVSSVGGGGSATGGHAFSGGGGSGGTATAGGAVSGGAASGGALGGSSSGGRAASSGGTSSSGGGISSSGGAGNGGSPAGGSANGSGGAQNELGPCPTGSEVKAGDSNWKVTVGSVERTFIFHAPSAYDGTTRLPVVIDFHGLSGNGMQQKSLSGWATEGDKKGFITVFPDGLEKAWNAGLCCSQTDPKSDDVAFVREMVKELASKACIDPKRIYASGCSNGGGMSFKLACEAADIIAGVAPVDFDCVDGASCSECDPARPISVVQFRGTADTLVDYEGAGAFVGAQKNFSIWGELNMCTEDPAAWTGNSACELRGGCSAGTETLLCTVDGGTHCGSYQKFKIAETAWEILQNHPLP